MIVIICDTELDRLRQFHSGSVDLLIIVGCNETAEPSFLELSSALAEGGELIIAPTLAAALAAGNSTQEP